MCSAISPDCKDTAARNAPLMLGVTAAALPHQPLLECGVKNIAVLEARKIGAAFDAWPA